MPNYQWPPDSFEAQALRAARERKDEERRREEDRRTQAQRAREARFAHLMASVFEDHWSRVQEQQCSQITELRYGQLLFSLVDVDNQREPVLSVSTQCAICEQTFQHHPVKNRADVGDVLAKLQQHSNCVSPGARAAAKRKQAEVRRALNL